MFKYIIDFAHGANGYAERINGLSDARDWCWQTWGPSREVDNIYIGRVERRWAWATDHYNIRLYLKDDEELTLFKLKF